jgi:hypothetical protein
VDPNNRTNTATATWTATPGKHTLTATANYEQGVSVDSAGVKILVIAGAKVTVKNVTSGWDPNPAYVEDIIGGDVAATIEPAGIDSDGTGPTYVTYNWSTVKVWQSLGEGTASTEAANYGLQYFRTIPSTRFWCWFMEPGYYILKVKCTATIHDSRTGASLLEVSGTGCIGGDDPESPPVEEGEVQARSAAENPPTFFEAVKAWPLTDDVG